MPSFSRSSRTKLESCHTQLQDVFNTVIQYWDCTILEGHRSKDVQNEYFRIGRSKLQYPDGSHNSVPSMGVDVVPYPIDWNDWNRFYAFSGFVIGVAASKGIVIRSGLDWDMDRNFKDQNFNDAPHFELKL